MYFEKVQSEPYYWGITPPTGNFLTHYWATAFRPLMISIGIYNDSSFEYLEKCLYRGNEVSLCALVAILSLEHGVGVSLSYNLNHCAMCCFSGSLKSFYFELRDFQISYMISCMIQWALRTLVIIYLIWNLTISICTICISYETLQYLSVLFAL